MEKRATVGVGFHMGSVLLMSLSPILNKFAIERLEVYEAALSNSFFALVFSFVWARAYRKPADLENIRAAWKPLLFMGLANGLGLVCLFTSLNLIGPVSVGFLGRFYIVFAILIGIIFLKERHRWSEYLMIAVVVVGTLMFSYSSSSSEGFGTVVALMFTLMFSVTNAIAKRIGDRVSSLSLLAVNSGSAFICTLGYFLIFSRGPLNPLDPGHLFAMASALLGATIGLWLFYRGLNFLSFSKANIIRSLQPIFVLAFAWPFFPKAMSGSQMAGAVFIVLGVVLMAWLNLTQKKADEVK